MFIICSNMYPGFRSAPSGLRLLKKVVANIPTAKASAA